MEPEHQGAGIDFGSGFGQRLDWMEVSAAALGGAIAGVSGIQGLFILAAGLGVGATAIVALSVRSSGPDRYAGPAKPPSEMTT
jgi:hypothetical protein